MNSRKVEILEIINKLADLQFQSDVWVNQVYWDRILNFGEAINTLDDYCFFDKSYYNKLKISKTELALIIQFQNQLLKYSEPCNTKLMIEDPTWLQLVKDAKVINKIITESEHDLERRNSSY